MNNARDAEESEMKLLKASSALLSVCLIIGALELARAGSYSFSSRLERQALSESATHRIPTTVRYRLDASRSKFVAHALPGGLLWLKGHEHLVAVREFTGEAQLTPDSITPASLEITAKTGSMVETSDAFTDAQKQIINKELREIVLLPATYPEIIFRSTSVTGKATGNNQYDLKITGDLSLHGVTREIAIPAKVTITGNELRTEGEFSIDRRDFKVKATSAVHGLVRVRNKVKFTFDIVGRRQ